MLIRGAEVWGHGLADVRIAGERIAAVGALSPQPGEAVLEAAGGLLLPGLHDHHIHLAGLAVRSSSIACGPPEVSGTAELAVALQRPGSGWIRGIGYHESVMGLPDRLALDALVADRPLRIQHRSGRLWLLNSAAISTLLARADAPPGLNRATGHLFDEDQWLQTALASSPPDFAAVSADLARRGITGVTDMSPRNDAAMAAHFQTQRDTGNLRQHALLAGTLGDWTRSPAKLHLHEAAFPDFDETLAFVAAAHEQGRGVAVHCVSEIELVFALALIEAAGAHPGDRIEHASVASPELVARIAALGLAVCVQPHFVAERGDRYLADVEPQYHADLYRLRTLREAGIALAAGSDAPFGGADPWAAMDAAVRRRTRAGQIISAAEALTPELALVLYLADPRDLAKQRRIAPGAPADLCLLTRPWTEVRADLAAAEVRATFVSGQVVHQAPA